MSDHPIGLDLEDDDDDDDGSFCTHVKDSLLILNLYPFSLLSLCIAFIPCYMICLSTYYP